MLLFPSYWESLDRYFLLNIFISFSFFFNLNLAKVFKQVKAEQKDLAQEINVKNPQYT